MNLNSAVPLSKLLVHRFVSLSLSLWLNVSLLLHNNSLGTTTDAAWSTHMTSWLPGRWGFLAQKAMWLAKPGKELLNGSKQSSVSTEDVCATVWKKENRFHLPIVHTVLISTACVIIKPSFPTSTHSASVFSSSCRALFYILQALRYFINFLVFLHFLSLPLTPDVWMYPICLCWGRGGQHWPQMAV